MAIARIENNAVAEVRTDLKLADVPPHKQAQWRPVVDTKPPFDPRYQTQTGPDVAVTANEVTRTWTVIDNDLANVKAYFKTLIDQRAEQERLKYITPGDGQMMEYREAFSQAQAVEAMGEAAANALSNNGADDFPVLAASIPTEAADLYAAAQLVIARYEAWASVGGAIKRIRIENKTAVDAAVDATAAAAAYDVFLGVTWP